VSNIALIEQDIYGTKDSFLSVLTDRSINFEREAGFAVQAIMNGTYLTKVAIGNRQSVVNAVNNVAAIGISLNPAKKQAYLVPRDGKVCLDISYIGLMDLAMATGSVRWAQAALVHAADTFVLNGFDKPPTHNFNPFASDRGDVVGVYVVVKTADGEYLTTTMSVDEVNGIRDRSSAWKAWVEKKSICPWVTDWGEMAKKTCVKRAYKFWPKTERLEQAIHHLNTDSGEGLASLERQNYAPSADVGKWIQQAKNCATKEALEATWKDGGSVLREANDKPGYAKLKEAVVARLAELSAAIDHQRADEEALIEQAYEESE
jgi:recombination protein RecT